ncbi:MAG: PEP-utilizing enzyme [Candidatus Micrarchaeota archaeon]
MKDEVWSDWFYASGVHSTYAIAQSSVMMSKDWGVDYGITIVAIENGKARWSSPRRKLLEIGKIAFTKLNDVKFKIKVWKAFRKDLKELESAYMKIERADLRKIENSLLLKLYSALSSAYYSMWRNSIFVDSVPIAGEEAILEKITGGKGKLPSDKATILSRLLSPTKKSFLAQEEYEREKINRAIPVKMVGLPYEKLQINHQKLIEAHSRKWFWMENNSLESKVLDGAYFWEIIRQEAPDGKANDRMEKAKETPITQREKIAILKKLHLGTEMLPFIAIMDEFGNFQDIRKMYWIRTMHYFDLLFNEMTKRLDITAIQLKNAFPWEIAEIMKGKKLNGPNLRERTGYSLIIFKHKTPLIFVGKEARTKYVEIFGDEKGIEDFAEIHGICASAGRVIGRVAILTSSKDISKLMGGDIMVAPSTDPEYVVAMKKAAAIVTDEGGITSHAAIVSRELGIPCLVGTKIASKVFKDGELVELDANHGVIRRLK